MCELFAVSAKKKIKLNFYLEEFFKHSVEHSSGWGLIAFDAEDVKVEKDDQRALDSHFLKEKLSKDVVSSDYFAHIRRATVGEISIKNNHPFVKKDALNQDWYLMHNGTIFESEELAKYQYQQHGTTDSERILFFLIDKVNELIHRGGRQLTLEEKCDIMNYLVLELSAGNKLNLIVYDGEYYYIHKNQEETLYYKEMDQTTIFSTTALDDEKWEEVPMNQLQVYKEGVCIYRGTVHQNTYIYDEGHYKYLYMSYASM